MSVSDMKPLVCPGCDGDVVYNVGARVTHRTYIYCTGCGLSIDGEDCRYKTYEALENAWRKAMQLRVDKLKLDLSTLVPVTENNGSRITWKQNRNETPKER